MNLFDTIRRSLLSVFTSLPLILIIVDGILAAGLGNGGIAWILAGQIILFAIVSLLRIVTSAFDLGNVPYSDAEVLIPITGVSTINILPSIWVVQVSYFFAYLGLNSFHIHKADPVDPGPQYEVKVNNRKSRTMMIMIASAFFLSLLLLARIWVNGNTVYVVVSAALGILAAWAWNVVGKEPKINVGNMDIFGISQQMMIIPNTDEKTVATLCQTANLR